MKASGGDEKREWDVATCDGASFYKKEARVAFFGFCFFNLLTSHTDMLLRSDIAIVM